MKIVPLPTPNHAEQVALFRHGVVGDLITSDLAVGELQAELKRRAKRLYRPAGSKTTRAYHWKTLQRWLYAARDSLAALQPECRQRGYGLALTPDARVVLLDMRQEHPTAAADLILDEAVRHGVVEMGAISRPTLRRLFTRADLARAPRNRQERHRNRRRWEADRVCRIWHADVCHVWQRDPDGRPVKRYVLGLLDDCSRFGLDPEAREARPILYVDNGATYRGDLLELALSKLGIRVVHPEPHDPEARGKMERFWRTLRQRMLDFQPPGATLHDLNASFLAWLDADYHRRPHGGPMGQTPARRFQEGVRNLAAPLTIEQIAAAFEVPRHATIRKDATFSVNGRLFEVRGRILAGKRIALALDPFTGLPIRANHDGKVIAFSACDPKANGRRSRGDVESPAVPTSTRSTASPASSPRPGSAQTVGTVSPAARVAATPRGDRGGAPADGAGPR